MERFTILKFITLPLVPVILSGCIATQPSFMFKHVERPETPPKTAEQELVEHSTNSIYINSESRVYISVDRAMFAELPEEGKGLGFTVGTKTPTKENQLDVIGNREVLIVADIYEGGVFTHSEIISDVVEHATKGKDVAITNPDFFEGNVDNGYIKIRFQAYEVDSSRIVRVLRKTTEYKNHRFKRSYSIKDALAGGIGNVAIGLVNAPAAIAGRPLDQIIAQAGADMIFEHSLYIVETADKNRQGFLADDDSAKLSLISNAGKTHFLDTDKWPDDLSPVYKENSIMEIKVECEKKRKE